MRRRDRLLLMILSLCLSCTLANQAAIVPVDAATQTSASVALIDEANKTEVPAPQAGGPMEDLLHWAVQHSDPERLKELMQKYKDSNLTLKDVYGKEVMDALFVNEASAMQTLINEISDFRNASVEDDSLVASLDRLEEFVEQIDNAGNLHRMGGLAPLLDLGLGHERGEEARAQALLTLGVAVQNNAPVQQDVMTVDGLSRMMALLPKCDARQGKPQEGTLVCIKLLFALSGLLKNDLPIQAEASRLGILNWLLGPGLLHPSMSVAKKSMGLLETILAQNPEIQFTPALTSADIATASKALLDHLQGRSDDQPLDLDVADSALRLISRLLSQQPLLFPASFRSELTSAVSKSLDRCRDAYGDIDEFCSGLTTVATAVDTMLTAQDIPNDEL